MTITVPTDEQWHEQLLTWRAALMKKLLAMKPAFRRDPNDPHTVGTARNLALSIDAIDEGKHIFNGTGWALESSQLGQLLRDAGYQQTGADPATNYTGLLPWYGSIADVQRRIATAATQQVIDDAQREESLLTDEQRAARDALRDIARTTANAQPQRKVRADGTAYWKFPDGHREEIVDDTTVVEESS